MSRSFRKNFDSLSGNDKSDRFMKRQAHKALRRAEKASLFMESEIFPTEREVSNEEFYYHAIKFYNGHGVRRK